MNSKRLEWFFIRTTGDASGLTRRHLLTASALALGGLAAGPRSLAAADPQEPAAGIVGNGARTSLHQEIELHAVPQSVYAALLDAKQFAAFSGMPAEIDPREGGAFRFFGGQIVGRNIELAPAARIVQAWRPAHWKPGIFSLANFQFHPSNAGTTVVLDHTSFPAGDYDSLFSGWFEHYWEPLKKYFA
jgi:activator of HSP90 ATPase